MKEKIIQEYENNGYTIRIIKPDVSKEEREKEDIRIIQKIRDSIEAMKKVS